ncbi:energy transducer TonB [Sphingosinithalassobacter portus]|uniref:energy transducer TonB n=1 Tax=Stakelama portus TaxID=2676234 RepID=UPI0011AB410B|nr:energy transducer TonB [Sphingosinithalassobacter portus]
MKWIAVTGAAIVGWLSVLPASAQTEPRLKSGWLNSQDYPRAAVRRHAQGVLVLGFTVDTDGRATDCQTLQSTGDALLDDQGCRIWTSRMRYEPARDAADEPVAANLQQQIVWTLGDVRRCPATVICISPY